MRDGPSAPGSVHTLLGGARATTRSPENGLDGKHAAVNVRETVLPQEEVRPMNAVFEWVLPLLVTVGRLT
ncbi:hypothetical protein GCM10018793_57580 [Streptomyces sulfonofaciens]|uniref:Uncharacterized protein n=1 Tax=Streptomyces sulfonofaciens TaxID=68272 RepID=A0A919L7H8_9ACTN|nr:hypothetical protein GCM10018793_57580 [Streptomyces sulfonofaciens]